MRWRPPRNCLLSHNEGVRVVDGVTVWFTGLPSAGKTTLAHATAERLATLGRRAQLLDGDQIRNWLSPDLGYSRQDREANILRIGHMARMLAYHGVVSVVAAIAPYESVRQSVRASHMDAGIPYREIYVSTPLDVCRTRDAKGLYARQAAGKLVGLTGVDDAYEPPLYPEATLDTSITPINAGVSRVLSLLGYGDE